MPPSLLGDYRACRRELDAVLVSVGAGLAEWSLGDMGEATRLMQECLRLKQSIGEGLGIGAALESLGWLTAETDPERAAVLLGAAHHEWEKIETSMMALPGLQARRDNAMATARSVLGNEAFDLASSRGHSLDQPSAIAFALGDRPARGAREGADARASSHILTQRERQVADLLHQGLSNQEIADALVISGRTVESHVDHILAKLGFRNRTQVATWWGELNRAESSSGSAGALAAAEVHAPEP